MIYSWAFLWGKKKKKNLIPKDECTPMFTAALFTGGTMQQFFFIIIAKTEEIKRVKTV